MTKTTINWLQATASSFVFVLAIALMTAGCSTGADPGAGESSTSSAASSQGAPTSSASASSSATVSQAPSSTTPSPTAGGLDTAFKLAESGGGKTITGHGLSLQIPGDWVAYEPESRGLDGTSLEWAVGVPEDTKPFPAGLQFSAGVAGKGSQLSTGLDVAAKALAERAPGYKFVDEGVADVGGASNAKFIRFRRDLDYKGSKTSAEQVSLFIQLSRDVTTTIRFIAPTGQWDAVMAMTYKSVKVVA